MADHSSPRSEPVPWQPGLVQRWGSVAHAPIGYWNSLSDAERESVSVAKLDELCAELQLVPLIAESTGLDADLVVVERVAAAELPRPDRLLAWLGVL